MTRVNRREFAKIMGGAALAVPLAHTVAWTQEAPKKPEPTKPALPPGEAAKPELKLKLTPKQEEAVQKAVERRDHQLATLRNRTLPYDAEPAFVFQVRQRPRSARKAG